MNTGIAGGIIQGWVAYKSPKRYKKYGSQKGCERVNQAPPEGDGFQEISQIARVSQSAGEFKFPSASS